MKNTQEKIAEIVGITPGMVSHLMTGRRSVSWKMANRLSAAFGKSPAWWMTADINRIKRVLRGSRKDGSNGNGGPNEQQQRAA
jgi:plasmid maintenance system antidote protein VapI